MTVDIAAYYDNTDIGVTGGASTGIANGMKVTAGNVKVLANNNNWMIARRTGPVAQCIFGDGPRGPSTWDAGTTYHEDTYEDLVVFPLPGDRGQRGYVVSFNVEHTGAVSAADAHVRIRIAGSTVSTTTVAQGSGTSQVSIDLDNPTGSDADMLIQIDSYYLRVWSVTVTRQRFINQTIPDAATAAPLYYMQDSRIATTQPLTDEWINRGLNNCNTLVNTQLHTLASVTMPIKNGTTIQDDGSAVEYQHDDQYPWGDIGQDELGNQPELAKFPLIVRYPQTVTIFAVFRAAAGSSLRIQMTPNSADGVAIDQNMTALPAVGSTYTFSKTTLNVTMGVYFPFVYFEHETTTSEKGYLYSLAVIGGPPITEI